MKNKIILISLLLSFIAFGFFYKATAVMGYMTKGVRGQDTVIAVTPEHPIPMTLTNLEDFSFLVNRDTNIFVTHYRFDEVTNSLVPISQYALDTALAREYSNLLYQAKGDYLLVVDTANRWQPIGDYQPAGVYLIPADTLNKWSAINHVHSIDDINGLNDWAFGTSESFLNLFVEAGLTNEYNIINVPNYIDVEVEKLKDSIQEVRTLANQNKIFNGNTGQVWKMLNSNTQGWGEDLQGEGTPNLDSYATITDLDTVKNNRAFKNHPHEFNEIVGLSSSIDDIQTEILNLQNVTNILLNTEPDTSAIAYNNRLLEEYLGYGDGYYFKCDTIQKVGANYSDNYFLPLNSTYDNKKRIIDYMSIQTDSTTIGYEIGIIGEETGWVPIKLFKNERLTGNVTVNFNLVGTPIVLQPHDYLYATKFLTNGEVKAKTWLSVKYRVR